MAPSCASPPVAGRRSPGAPVAVEIRVRGCVQGVGFRPTVWRIARDLGLDGEVLNDGEGVLIRARGGRGAGRGLARSPRARAAAPGADRAHRDRQILPAACPAASILPPAGAGAAHTRIVARRGDLPGLRRRSARSRRTALPVSLYQLHPLRAAADDRRSASLTTASGRRWRRFRCARPASPNTAIPPTAVSMRRRSPAPMRAARDAAPDRRPASQRDRDSTGEAAEAAARLIRTARSSRSRGSAAITSPATRPMPTRSPGCAALKHRDAKPFALMARDLAMVRRYCTVAPEEERALDRARRRRSWCCAADGPERLPDAVAPGSRHAGVHAADDAAAPPGDGAGWKARR